MNYAGFWRRTSASLLDVIITAPILISLIYLFGLDKYLVFEVSEDLSSYIENESFILNRTLIDITSVFLISFYSVFFIASRRMATPGKMLFGIYVVDEHGDQISKSKALARFFISILSTLFLGLGMLTIFLTKEKLALHDIICKTRVIKKGKNEDE